MLREQAAQLGQLLHAAFVRFLDPLELVGELGTGHALGPGPLLGGAARFVRAQPLDLAAQGRRLLLRLGASRRLPLEPLVLVGEHTPGLFRRAEVAPRRAFEVRQPLPDGAPAAVDGRRDGHRIDREHGRRRCLGAFALREELVEKQSRSPRTVRRVGRGGRRPVDA